MARNLILSEIIGGINGYKAPLFGQETPHFRDHIVQLERSGKRAEDLARYLLREGIVGGAVLTQRFPDLGETLLFGVNNRQTLDDYNRLGEALGGFI